MTRVIGEMPEGVNVTAIGMVAVRAWESLRSDGLFDDPLAARFVEAAGWPFPSPNTEY